MRNSHLMQEFWKSLVAVTVVATSAAAQQTGSVESATSIEWRTSYRRAADEATRDGKPILIKVSATWCGPCRQMKQLTFGDTRVVELVRTDYVPLAIDADEHPDLVAGFSIEAYPTTIIVAPDRKILKKMKGYQSADALILNLASVPRTHTVNRPVTDAVDALSALEPANAVKLGFDGYCLVSLLEETKVRRGSTEFVAEHRGQTLCFLSDEHRQKFLSDPDKYWPVADGNCLVSSREGSTAGPGDPRLAVTWRGRIWMFSDRERQRRFIQTPRYYANEM